MRCLILLCLAVLSLTAAAAWASPFTARPVSTPSGKMARIASSVSFHQHATHRQRRSRPTTTMLFGDQAVESSLANAPRGRSEAFPFKNTSTGLASSVAVYLPSQNRAKLLVIGLYSARHGQPGRLVASGSLSALRVRAWNSVKIPATHVKPGTYWVAVLSERGTLYFRVRSHRSCGSTRARSSTVAALPSSWKGGSRANGCPISAHVDGKRTSVGKGSSTKAPIVAGTLSLASPTSSTGGASASAPTDSPPIAIPPVNTGAPTVSGSTVAGAVLTAANGSWIDSPTAYAFQWQDCTTVGLGCTDINGATSSSYTLAVSDVGDTVRVVVTASNAGGSTAARSAQTGVVLPPPPANTGLPTLSGAAVEGQTLTTTNGSWSGSPTGYSYAWEDCNSSGASCTTINSAIASTYTLTSGDVGQTTRSVVTATNAGGSTAASSAQTGVVTSSAGLPSGVSLQQIDGGSNYYCSNGFTDACSDGWDSASFFPILDDYAFYPGNSTSTFKSLGLTSSVRVTGGTNMSTLRSAGVTAIPANDSATNFGSESVGGHIEEPGSWSNITSQASSLNSLFGLSGRFLQGSFTWNQLYYQNVSGSACGGSGTMTMQEIFSCTSGMPNGQHLNIATDDLYWFAGSGCSGIQYMGGNVERNGGTATADQMARGSNYGDMVDIMRGWLAAPAQDAPIAPYIETEDGLLTCPSPDTGSIREITPSELSWAVWSTIVHGARMLIYFGTTSNFGSGSTFGFSQNVLPGQSISMYTQGSDTNKLVEDLAPIINSPFALNYASVTPAGYTFPTEDLGWKSTPGIDVMTKYYTGGSFTNSSGTFGNGFYIIATPRASESASNIAATFTIPGSYSGPVNVIDASTGAPATSTLTVSSHKITDTFAHAYDTHIIGPIPNQ
jgi:hypothetical protein